MQHQQPTTEQDWQRALDPRLLQRLLWPLAHAGVIPPGLARSILARIQRMSGGLPLLAQLMRHLAAEEISPDLPPIVYPRPAPQAPASAPAGAQIAERVVIRPLLVAPRAGPAAVAAAPIPTAAEHQIVRGRPAKGAVGAAAAATSAPAAREVAERQAAPPAPTPLADLQQFVLPPGRRLRRPPDAAEPANMAPAQQNDAPRVQQASHPAPGSVRLPERVNDSVALPARLPLPVVQTSAAADAPPQRQPKASTMPVRDALLTGAQQPAPQGRPIVAPTVLASWPPTTSGPPLPVGSLANHRPAPSRNGAPTQRMPDAPTQRTVDTSSGRAPEALGQHTNGTAALTADAPASLAQPFAPAKQAIVVEELVDKALRKLIRELDVEAERKGWRR